MSIASSPLGRLLDRYRRGLVLVVLLATSSLLILFNGTPGIARPQEIGLTVLGFFQGVVSGTVHATTQAGGSVGDLFNLQARYQKVEAQLKRYEGNERTLVLLREENARLRQQLEFHQKLPYFNIPVEVIGRDPSKVYSSFVVSKGYLDGIRKDMAVVAGQDGTVGLVGKVVEVGLTSSVVQPILDANLFVAARLENTRYEGLVAGRGNNRESLTMSYVQKSAQSEIRPGDVVVSAGLDSIYPSDILIGRVVDVVSKEYQTSLEVHLQPVLDFDRLEYLNILREQE